ncbi:MAG: hypothetical protein K1060chlam1_01310 [Candidatus Anoxychlamydiales bacterium]|nr:hypothetical protein [Candidatus Anoxychlamydiales bacterium]
MFSQKNEERMKGRKAKLPKALFEHDFTSIAKKEPMLGLDNVFLFYLI